MLHLFKDYNFRAANSNLFVKVWTVSNEREKEQEKNLEFAASTIMSAIRLRAIQNIDKDHYHHLGNIMMVGSLISFNKFRCNSFLFRFSNEIINKIFIGKTHRGQLLKTIWVLTEIKEHLIKLYVSESFQRHIKMDSF